MIRNEPRIGDIKRKVLLLLLAGLALGLTRSGKKQLWILKQIPKEWKKENRQALQFNINKIEIKKPIKWDRKWRIVMFDIPEKLKGLRDSLRLHFREIGMIELQKSVLVYPYPCN